MNMRILFITRKYPPSIGGMETFSAGFYHAMRDNCTLLHKHLIRAWWLVWRYDLIHLGDGVLAGLGVLLKWITRKPVTITVHGLDVTYHKFGYQTYIKFCLARLDQIIAVSQATAQAVRQRLPHCQVSVIPNGVVMADWPISNQARNDHLLFVGRLVPRKGCAWFVNNVLPQLPAHLILDVIGDGEEYSALMNIDRVRLHGQVDTATIKKLYMESALCIMPNIKMPGNMEGFGIVAIEAGACGLPVLAARLEGMESVIIDGTTGFLIESGNVEAWIKAIQDSFDQPFSATVIRQTVANRFDWNKVKQNYLDLFYGLHSTNGSAHD